MPVALRRAGFSAVCLFIGQKLKISHEQTVSIFQFYLRLLNFRLLVSIIKKVPRAGRSPYTFTLALAFHVGPISTNCHSRPNLKVQKKQVSEELSLLSVIT